MIKENALPSDSSVWPFGYPTPEFCQSSIISMKRSVAKQIYTTMLKTHSKETVLKIIAKIAGLWEQTDK